MKRDGANVPHETVTAAAVDRKLSLLRERRREREKERQTAQKLKSLAKKERGKVNGKKTYLYQPVTAPLGRVWRVRKGGKQQQHVQFIKRTHMVRQGRKSNRFRSRFYFGGSAIALNSQRTRGASWVMLSFWLILHYFPIGLRFGHHYTLNLTHNCVCVCVSFYPGKCIVPHDSLRWSVAACCRLN